MRRDGGRARRWPLMAAALSTLLAGALLAGAPAASADTSTPTPDATTPATGPGTTDPAGTVVAALPGVSVHDDLRCQGPETATVTGDFSVQVTGLVGGPLGAVTVRSDALVVASGVVMLDDQGAGCTDLAAIDPGTYVVTASLGDLAVDASVVVPAPVDPPVTASPEPPPPDPTPTDPPTETVAPPDPQPSDTAPTGEATSPAREASPSPTPVVTPPEAVPTGIAVPPAASRSEDDPAMRRSAAPRPSAGVTPPAQPSPAPPAAVQAATPAATATAILDSTTAATSRIVAVLASSDRPAAVTIAGFVILEVLGVALLVAFVVLVISRSPRRRD